MLGDYFPYPKTGGGGGGGGGGLCTSNQSF